MCIDKSKLDAMAVDPDEVLREIVADVSDHREHLDMLVRDPDPEVREAVARRGYREHLDILADDADVCVRFTARIMRAIATRAA